MKSSGPLFTRQNPFKAASRVEKTHYHPSRKKSLSKKEKNTILSPVRLNQRSSPRLVSVRPDSHQRVGKQDRQLSSTDGQPVFAESWPSTDSESSPANTRVSSDLDKQSAMAGKSTASSEFEVEQASVLAKYVERFRHAPPQRREERQKMYSVTGETELPFWWMSPSSPSSSPTKTKDKDVIQYLKDDHGPAVFSPAGEHQRDRCLSPSRRSLNILSDISQSEFDDTEILQLQDRANRLLLREYNAQQVEFKMESVIPSTVTFCTSYSECTLSDGSIHVSSEGLGCSDFSSQVSGNEALRRPFIPSMLKSTTTVKASSDSIQDVSSQKPSVIPSVVTPTRPEDDILFQWRLRRKIEQAREWTQPLQHSTFHSPTFSWQAPTLNHPTASGQIYKQQQSTQPPEFSQEAAHPHITHPQPETEFAHVSCPPASGVSALPDFGVSGSSVSHPQAIGHVPAHMHLLCDVLPCPIQSSHAYRQPNISQSIGESHVRVAHKTTQVSGHSVNSSTDQPLHEHVPSPPPASSGAVGRVTPRDCKRCENEKAKTKGPVQKTPMSFRKQKTSRHAVGNREQADVPGSIQKVPKKMLPQAEQQRHGGSQKNSREGCMEECAPPSPIHSALGQVVSEVLFAEPDSSPAQRVSVSSVSPRTTSAPLPSSGPPCDAQNSMEVISQLLREADDSDEGEFDGDPLLQVLRKQRSWVKEQISEVDSLLNDLMDKQQVTHTPTRDI